MIYKYTIFRHKLTENKIEQLSKNGTFELDCDAVTFFDDESAAENYAKYLADVKDGYIYCVSRYKVEPDPLYAIKTFGVDHHMLDDHFDPELEVMPK